MYTKDKFKNNEELVTYYTGLVDFNALNALFDLVKLDIVTKRGLTRLRFGLAVVDLANRFQICKTIVSKAFLLMLDVLYVKLTPIIVWQERSELIAAMPMCFRTKVGTKITTIIDCFELHIKRPTNLIARSLTWSYYKNSRLAETVSAFGARLEIPSFTKEKELFRAAESTRMISNVWIHVERAIGNLRKKYSLLDQTLPIDFIITERAKSSNIR